MSRRSGVLEGRGSELAARCAEGARQLLVSACDSGWSGPDPYDGLEPSWPAFAVAGKRRRQAVVQLHARAPFDIRRFYGRGRYRPIPKTSGVFASAAVRLHAATRETELLEAARNALGLALADDGAGGWGYPWDVQTRWSFYPAGSPNVVVTAFTAAGLADAAGPCARPRYRRRARLAARWALDALYRPERGFFAYHAGSEQLVHNASLLGAALVHEQLEGDPTADEAVRHAVATTLAAQRRDGSWPYGDGAGLGWVDSFHSGYVLECLCRLAPVDARIDAAVSRGAAYYAERFFDAAGRAMLYATARYPEDAHAAGTGLTTLSRLVVDGRADPALLERVARRTVERGLSNGRAIARRHRVGAARVRYIRWCDAPVALGLANAALALSETRAAPFPFLD